MPCKDICRASQGLHIHYAMPSINSQLRFMYLSFGNPWKSEFYPSKINVQPCCRRRLHLPCPSCVTIDATERPMEKTTPPSQDFARCLWPLSNPCRKLATSREGHVVVIFYMSDSVLHQTSSVSDAGEPISIDLSPLIILICPPAHVRVFLWSLHEIVVWLPYACWADQPCPLVHPCILKEATTDMLNLAELNFLPARHSQGLHHGNC
jgi:hypothetical protein